MQHHLRSRLKYHSNHISHSLLSRIEQHQTVQILRFWWAWNPTQALKNHYSHFRYSRTPISYRGNRQYMAHTVVIVDYKAKVSFVLTFTPSVSNTHRQGSTLRAAQAMGGKVRFMILRWPSHCCFRSTNMLNYIPKVSLLKDASPGLQVDHRHTVQALYPTAAESIKPNHIHGTRLCTGHWINTIRHICGGLRIMTKKSYEYCYYCNCLHQQINVRLAIKVECDSHLAFVLCSIAEELYVCQLAEHSNRQSHCYQWSDCLQTDAKWLHCKSLLWYKELSSMKGSSRYSEALQAAVITRIGAQ